MFSKLATTLIAAAALAFAFSAHAATDVNTASQAELETVKGIGPSMSGKILDERNKGKFKDWPDMVSRIKGVGPANASKFSADGLVVNGAAYTPELVAANQPRPATAASGENVKGKTAPPTAAAKK